MKGRSTCPMCRDTMCFKGITKMKDKWFHEKQEEVYAELVTKIFEELGETYDDIILSCIEVVQTRFNYIMKKYPGIPCEILDLILGMTWLDINYLLNVRQEKIYEPRTYEKYLMVSRYEKKSLSETSPHYVFNENG